MKKFYKKPLLSLIFADIDILATSTDPEFGVNYNDLWGDTQ